MRNSAKAAETSNALSGTSQLTEIPLQPSRGKGRDFTRRRKPGYTKGVKDLRDFLEVLEQEGELARISVAVSPELEIAEVTDRVCKGPSELNKALFFERVSGYRIPVLTNLFGSPKRMALALRARTLEELEERLEKPLRLLEGPVGIVEGGRILTEFLRSMVPRPKLLRHAPCQREIFRGKEADLSVLPILKGWPEDGGRFITLPQVVTRDPETGKRNVGMYRLQVVDERTLLVHWQRHKGGAHHAKEASRKGINKIPCAVALGGDPAAIWAASAPLPPSLDEYTFASWLRGSSLEMVPCVSQPLEVPAHAEIVIEGYVDLEDLRDEGPFGDHTGFYTPKEPFPAMHLTAITMRRDPLYPATVMGIPPMEDFFMGQATERLFLPLLRLVLPEIRDLYMPPEGVFHNLVLVSIRKTFPGQGRKVIHGLWGLGMMSLAKAIVVVDDEVDVRNPREVAWYTLGNVDWKRDVIITEGPVDQLDHPSPFPCFGGKIGIDATRKLPEEGHVRPWPKRVRMSREVREEVDRKWPKILEALRK